LFFHVQRSLLMGDVFVTMLAYRKFFPTCAWRAKLYFMPQASLKTAIQQGGQCLRKRRPPSLPTGGKLIGSVPFSVTGVVASSAWHHRQGDIGDQVKASRPSRKERNR
jgi:hypothetical protein